MLNRYNVWAPLNSRQSHSTKNLTYVATGMASRYRGDGFKIISSLSPIYHRYTRCLADLATVIIGEDEGRL